MRNHSKLRAFELADKLVIRVYEVTRNFPKDELFGLTAQLRRAGVSAASNIVEGCARNTEADFIRFLDIAFGSIREVNYQLTLATRLGYVDQKTGESIQSLGIETSKVLSGLIRALRKKPPNNHK